jgi:hypothetical protein
MSNKQIAVNIIKRFKSKGHKAYIYHVSYSGSTYIEVKVNGQKTRIRVSNHMPYHAKVEKYNVMSNERDKLFVSRTRNRYYGVSNIDQLMNDILERFGRNS